MRRKNSRSPRIEGLESRALLAGLHSVAAPVMPLGNVLNGTTNGSYWDAVGEQGRKFDHL